MSNNNSSTINKISLHLNKHVDYKSTTNVVLLVTYICSPIYNFMVDCRSLQNILEILYLINFLA